MQYQLAGLLGAPMLEILENHRMFLVAYRHLTFAVWVLVWDKAMEGVLINSFSFHVFCLKYFSLPAKACIIKNVPHSGAQILASKHGSSNLQSSA